MGPFRHLTIASKVYTVVGLLAASGVVSGAVGLHGMQKYTLQVGEMRNASERAMKGAVINGLINAVVMDSRGVYMARDQAEVDKFSKPMLASLETIHRTFDEWIALLPAPRRPEMQAAIRNIAAFEGSRRELVRLGQEKGAAAAREFGDNDANRRRRQALNIEVVALSDANNKEIARGGVELAQFRQAQTMLMAGAGLAMLAIIVVAIVVVRRSIVRPIAELTTAMHSLAARDFDVRIPGSGQHNELGTMASAVQVFKDNMAKADRLAAEQDAERVVKEQRAIHLEELVQNFETKVGGLVGMLSAASTELEATAQSMSSTATETNHQASMVATAAGESSIGMQTVAAAAEQLTASISEISQQVLQSAKATEAAVADARHTNAIVQKLAEGAHKIGDVVSLISTIAGQTNLLALNATIEAARAGDAGKGFAVVASEVKNLAQKTAQATGEISAQVQQVQTATTEAIEAIRGITTRIEEVSAIAAAIAAAVEEQGAATNEIARNIQQTASNTQTVTSSIVGVSQAASDTGVAASQVLSAAGDLSKQAEQLTYEVNGFVADVRAA